MINEDAVITFVDTLIYLIFKLFKFISKVWSRIRKKERRIENKNKLKQAKQYAKDWFIRYSRKLIWRIISHNCELVRAELVKKDGH